MQGGTVTCRRERPLASLLAIVPEAFRHFDASPPRSINPSRLPVLLMDLKGEAYNPDTINTVAAAAAAVDAQAHVALFVTQPAQAALVRNQTTWGGPLIRGYLVGAAAAAGWLLGPLSDCAGGGAGRPPSHLTPRRRFGGWCRQHGHCEQQ